MSITLYTTGCPRCNVLEKKLDAKGVDYKKNLDIDEMIAMGFSEAPLLKVDDRVMNFGEANKWVNEL